MQVFRNDMAAYFDVDETLVLWYPSGSNPADLPEEAIEIVNPEDSTIRCWALPHAPHINKLKEHKTRGQLVVVWSAGGHAWAEATVKRLGLERYVDVVLAKPAWAWDDLTPNEFIHQRCYIPFDRYPQQQISLRNT